MPVVSKMGIGKLVSSCKQLISRGLVELALVAFGEYADSTNFALLYEKFSPISLNHVTWLDCIWMYHELLDLVPFLATSLSDVGLVKGYEFDIKLKIDRPFYAPPIRYAPTERVWLKQYLD